MILGAPNNRSEPLVCFASSIAILSGRHGLFYFDGRLHVPGPLLRVATTPATTAGPAEPLSSHGKKKAAATRCNGFL